jgi:hypothetical protein
MAATPGLDGDLDDFAQLPLHLMFCQLEFLCKKAPKVGEQAAG